MSEEHPGDESRRDPPTMTVPVSRDEAVGGDGEPVPEADAAGESSRRRHSRRRVASEWGVVLIAALLLAFVIRTFAVQAFFIPSASMEPTLNIGDRILVDKAFFDYHHLQRGDIIVFTQPPRDTCGSSETDLVKRVIGLPGQTIRSQGNSIYVDGKRISEPYLPRDDPLGPVRITPQKIKPDNFYVLGDNRAISCDSRYWGTVVGDTIVGKVDLRWWHNGRPDIHFF
ncbi:MAG TPA: signal peptidase I [Acidimicrobiales bacterium]|nr:signal peptidase I [Acidimicrobiales bacterium]